MVKKRCKSMPFLLWIPLILIPLIFYSIYTYSDIIWTTKNGLTVWYILTEGKSIGEFYSTPYPLDSNIQHAYYDFFIYIIFAIWDFPLFIYEKITHTSFMNNYIALWYAKTIILPFWGACAYQVYKITQLITNDLEKAKWSVFSFIFSIMSFQAIIIIGGYDVISLFFTLCGISAYLKNENKRFILWFAGAIACKMFALWIFIPLVLLKWKNIFKIARIFLESISFIIIPKLYFILYEKISGVDTLIDGVDNGISSPMYIDEYLWSSEAPLALSSIPLFFAITFLIWVLCWFNKKEITFEFVIYVAFLGMSTFIMTCDTHPQWIILIVPYIAILECINWNKISLKVFFEICMGITAILWQLRRRPQCYSYNIVNNMLHLEEGDREFWFTGIWMFISKLENIIGISIDHIWVVFRSILVVSFLALVFLLRPKADKDCNLDKEGKNWFLIKASCSILILSIPLLGVLLRSMGY